MRDLEVRMRSIAESALSASESDLLSRWCAGFSRDVVCDADHGACDRVVGARLNDIPPRLQNLIRSFGEHSDSPGVLHLRGVPVPDGLPATPNQLSGGAYEATGTEPVLLGVGLLIGEPISYAHWRGGERVHNVYPIEEDAATQKSTGSVRLDFHTEVAFRPQPPDVLALLCLRAGGAPPPTLFCDLREAWDRLDANTQSLLCEPAFGLPGAGLDGMADGVARQPVCRACADGLRFQFDAGMRGATPRHEAAIARLRAELDQAAVELTLLAGDLALVDNRRMVHGRAPFSPGYAGDDRWLQRCLIRYR